jgi:hypothetical protein
MYRLGKKTRGRQSARMKNEMSVSYGVTRNGPTKFSKGYAQKSGTVSAQKVTNVCFINECEISLREHSQRPRHYASNFCDVRHGFDSTVTRIREGYSELSRGEYSSGCVLCRHVETPLGTKLSGEIRDGIEERSGTARLRSGARMRCQPTVRQRCNLPHARCFSAARQRPSEPRSPSSPPSPDSRQLVSRMPTGSYSSCPGRSATLA